MNSVDNEKLPEVSWEVYNALQAYKLAINRLRGKLADLALAEGSVNQADKRLAVYRTHVSNRGNELLLMLADRNTA